MRIFHAFLVIVAAIILFMLPLTMAVYSFRTDTREDSFSVTTGAASTNATVVLIKPLYADDTAKIVFDSSIAETPTVGLWTSATKSLVVDSLTANTTRTLLVTYDVAAFSATSAISNLLDKLPFIWLLMIIAFIPAALVAIFMGKA